MKRLALIFLVLFTAGQVNAAILVRSPDGGFVSKKSLDAANTDTDCANKTIIISSPQTISKDTVLASDRTWRIEKGGSINHGIYALRFKGSFEAGQSQVFSGEGIVTFDAGSVNEVSPLWWGGKGDGITDDTKAIQSAVDSLGDSGGTVALTSTLRYYVSSNLTIGNNVNIKGPHAFVGSPGNNKAMDYGKLGGAILLNPLSTITLKSGAGLSGLLIYRSGMTFPAYNSSAFAGTAITVSGDDAFVFKCMVLGFNKAFYSNGYQRPRIDYLLGDNINGIEITNCSDVAYISNCHMWPFATIAASSNSPAWAERAGSAYNLHDTVDWGKLTNCFSYGYKFGFYISNANSITLLSCGADNTKSFIGSIGFNISGTATDTRLIGCQAAAQDTGYFINTGPGQATIMDSCVGWGNTVRAESRNIWVQIGDISVNGGIFRDGQTGVYINSPDSRVMINGVRFSQNASSPIYNHAQSPYVFIGINDYGENITSSSVHLGAVMHLASAENIALPSGGDVYTVSGHKNISTITGGYNGRKITLIFEGTLSVLHDGLSTNGLILAGGAAFNTSEKSTLSLVFSAGSWIETSRKQ